MALLGQASGGWTESSSALRLLHVGVRNSTGVLTDDAFTQANPLSITVANTISTNLDATATGVLSGSICYARNDAGENFIGGPTNGPGGTAMGVADARQRPLGLFINSANGNAFENTPGTASGKGPYTSSQGTYGNSLFETQNLNTAAALVYVAGDMLVGSMNGFLTNVVAANNSHDRDHIILDGVGAAMQYEIAVLKMAPDAVQNELVFDQRI